MNIYLIDGSAVCYRAYYAYATRELKNSRGFPTNVPYGFVLCLKKILNDFKPDGLVVMFDLKGPTTRHAKYADYKANRKPTPDDLIAQLPFVRRIVEGYRFKIVERQGVEADDLIGTYAARLSAAGHNAVIVTSDKDAFQLVDDRVGIVDPGKDYAYFGPKEARERFGVEPKRIPDFLALAGDSSDNIPGIAGIGPKSALDLLRKFGSLDGIYERLDEVEGESKKKMLGQSRDQARMFLDLATIDTAIPVDFNAGELELEPPDAAKLTEVYKELEFRSFLKDLPRNSDGPADAKDFRLVADAKDLGALVKELRGAKAFSLDFETTGTDPLTAEPVGLSFSFRDHQAFFILFDTHQSKKSTLASKDVLARLKTLLEDPGVAKVGQNIKYETMLLGRFGVRLEGVAFDTMVASYLLNPAKPNHNLADIALEHLNEQLVRIEELIGSGKKQVTMAESDVDALVRYGCQDADTTFRLWKVLGAKIGASGMPDLLEKMEMPLVGVLAAMETEGVAIDRAYLEALSSEMEARILRISEEVWKLSGSRFNLNSPKQLSEILFGQLKLPVVRRTKTGYSTDEAVLVELSGLHELPRLLLQHREVSKLKSTYADAMPLLINPATGRIHSSFNQTVTATGRLSSSDPNLQNIPVRTEEGRRIRKAFVAPAGRMLLSADYSQIELRILAHLSKDQALTRAFCRNLDIHAYTAALVFGVAESEVTPRMRDEAKTVNFGVLYGMSGFGLARSLKISQEAARDFIKAYFERYPEVKLFMDRTLEEARQKGYVETLLGRRRYIPDISSGDMRLRQFAERTAINAPVQGTASDLIKLAMVEIHREIERSALEGRMIIQVHDELVFEVPSKTLPDFAAMVREKMEKALILDVPLVVTRKAGPNWMEMEKI